MRRVERPGRVVYIERHWKMSVLMFLTALATLALYAWLSYPDLWKEPGGALVYPGGFLVSALVLQQRSRAFVFDAGAGKVLIVEQRFLKPTLRQELPMRDLTVRTTSAVEESHFTQDSRRHWIWLETPGRPRILFKGYIRGQDRVHDWVVQLRRDLDLVAP